MAQGTGYDKVIADPSGQPWYTVRPRYASSLTKSRGTRSRIKFNPPGGVEAMTGATQELVKAAGDGYFDFLVEQMSYSIQEKSQTIQTFGGAQATYFYGKAPVQVTFSGTLCDDLDGDQFVRFMMLYKEFLSGSEMSRKYCSCDISFPNVRFGGAFTGINISQQAERDTDIQFTATFLAYDFTFISVDALFKEVLGNSSPQPVIAVRGPDPTITMKAMDGVSLTDVEMARLKPVISHNDPANNIPGLGLTGGASFGDIHTESRGTGWANDFIAWATAPVRKLFDKIPDVSLWLPFSFGDIMQFFQDGLDFVNTVVNTVQDVIGQVSDFTGKVVAFVEGIEGKISQGIHSIRSVINAIFGTVDEIKNTVTTICNFPKTVSTTLKAFAGAGSIAPPVAGSDSISPETAMGLLVAQPNLGSARGTALGEAAALAVSTQAALTASITPSSETGGSNSLTPGAGSGSLTPSLPPVSPSTASSSTAGATIAPAPGRASNASLRPSNGKSSSSASGSVPTLHIVSVGG